MKKIVFVMVGLLAIVAIGGTASAGKNDDTKKFDSEITVNYDDGGTGPYAEEPAFKGKVKSDKDACERERKVTVKRRSNGDTVGSVFTDDDGKYRIGAAGFGPGKYDAKASKKVIKKDNGDKIICKKAEASVTVN